MASQFGIFWKIESLVNDVDARKPTPWLVFKGMVEILLRQTQSDSGQGFVSQCLAD
jgi:hypothetical protein